MFDITQGANMLTKRSSIWLTVTALLIHCSAIKSRVMPWQFMAFTSSRIADKAAVLLKIRHVRFGQNTWNGPCDVLALIWPHAFPAPLEPAGAIMWQQNTIVSRVSHRRRIAARFFPHWCDSCERAANGRTRDNDPKQKWDDSGGTDWWWNYSVKSALKIKLRLMDGIVFCDGTVDPLNDNFQNRYLKKMGEHIQFYGNAAISCCLFWTENSKWMNFYLFLLINCLTLGSKETRNSSVE